MAAGGCVAAGQWWLKGATALEARFLWVVAVSGVGVQSRLAGCCHRSVMSCTREMWGVMWLAQTSGAPSCLTAVWKGCTLLEEPSSFVVVTTAGKQCSRGGPRLVKHCGRCEPTRGPRLFSHHGRPAGIERTASPLVRPVRVTRHFGKEHRSDHARPMHTVTVAGPVAGTSAATRVKQRVVTPTKARQCNALARTVECLKRPDPCWRSSAGQKTNCSTKPGPPTPQHALNCGYLAGRHPAAGRRTLLTQHKRRTTGDHADQAQQRLNPAERGAPSNIGSCSLPGTRASPRLRAAVVRSAAALPEAAGPIPARAGIRLADLQL